jgi:NADPH:quinone reductase-like Zn-dependent oxidoreductase
MKTTNRPQESASVLNHHGENMKAVRIHSYGDASVLSYEDAPVPEIGPDDILIKIHAAGVNPIDWKKREGYTDFLAYHNPGILGWDVSGTVEEMGPLVTRFKIGDSVFSNPTPTRDGGYAEYIAVHSFEVVHAPQKISLEQAAAVPLASQTAWTALFEKANLKSGQSVLIHAASGGVGSFAVQLAKMAGAYVIGTCSKKNIDLVKSLGADEVIDYQTEDFSTKVKNADVVFDTIGGETQLKSFNVLKKGGVLVSAVGITDPNAADKYGVRAIAFSMVTCGSRLEEIAGLIDKGLLKVIIDKTFPLSEVKEAHRLSESHHARGKIILKIV